MSLAAVPEGIDPVQVRGYLESLPGVTAAHDLHIWAMSTSETALTCHLVMPKGHPGDAFLAEISHELHRRFGSGTRACRSNSPMPARAPSRRNTWFRAI